MSVCVLGSINLDNVCQVPRLPGAGETLMAESLQRFPGGKGANQAVAAAAWGVPSALIGAVGRDEPGEVLLAHLKARGVDVSAVARVAAAPSGQAYICVSPTGENMIVVIGGANMALTAAGVANSNLAGRVFLSQLESPAPAVEALFASRTARRGLRILNAAPAVEAGRALFPLVDIVVVNRGELAHYAGAAEPATFVDAIPLARGLIDRPDQTIIVTLGAAGALAVTRDTHRLAEGAPAEVVDTTGAGDCFCGVLAAALSDGCSLFDALVWANLAAAISTEQAGAVVSPTLRAEAQQRLSAWREVPATPSPPQPDRPRRLSRN